MRAATGSMSARDVESGVAVRRTVRLAAIVEQDADDQPPSAPPMPVRRRRALPVSRDDWLVLAEHVVGDWAATLRAALVAVLVFVGMVIMIGVTFGPGSALVTAGLGLIVFLAGRRHAPHD